MEMEQGVLGCVLLDPSLLEMVRERVPDTVASFYDLKHQTLMEALIDMQADRKSIDVLTLGQRLRDAGQLDGVGGLSYLSELMDGVPSTANLTYYLEDLVDLYQRRRVLALGTELIGEAYSGKRGGEELADGRHDHLVLGTDARGGQGQMERGRAVVGHHGIGDLAVLGQQLLKAIDVGPSGRDPGRLNAVHDVECFVAIEHRFGDSNAAFDAMIHR
jgi:replicative DNA helicase